MEPVALTLFVALAIFALLRTPGVFSPAEVMAVAGKACRLEIPGEEDEEELPQTDQAPPRNWLPWAVAAVGTARLVMLVALRA